MLLNCGVGENSWVPWTARRSNQSILKEINPEFSMEWLMLKLKLQYFGHLMQRADSLEKTLMLGKMEGRRRVGWQDEMVGWHHWLNGHEFEQASGAGDGQGSLAMQQSMVQQRVGHSLVTEQEVWLLGIANHFLWYLEETYCFSVYDQLELYPGQMNWVKLRV